MFDWQVQLVKLPRWASVAIAARCARRVQKLFGNWPVADESMLQLIERTISLAERAGLTTTVSETTVVDDSDRIAKAADAAGEFVARYAAESASHAAVAGVAYRSGLCPRERTIRAAQSALEAMNSTGAARTANLARFMAALEADIERVRADVAEGVIGEIPPGGNYFGSIWSHKGTCDECRASGVFVEPSAAMSPAEPSPVSLCGRCRLEVETP